MMFITKISLICCCSELKPQFEHLVEEHNYAIQSSKHDLQQRVFTCLIIVDIFLLHLLFRERYFSVFSTIDFSIDTQWTNLMDSRPDRFSFAHRFSFSLYTPCCVKRNQFILDLTLAFLGRFL